jgi:hypothetical protein
MDTQHPWDHAAESMPAIPAPTTLWRPVRGWTWTAVALLILAAIPDYFVQYWFNSSLGFHTVFFTNLGTQALLAAVYGGLTFALIALPARRYGVSAGLRNTTYHVGAWIAIYAGWRAASHYQEFLLAFYGVPFNTIDPVFGNDVGFYVYWLPIIRVTLSGLLWTFVLSTASTIVMRYDHMRRSACSRARTSAGPPHRAVLPALDAPHLGRGGVGGCRRALHLALFAPAQRQRAGGRAHWRAIRRRGGLLFNPELHPRQRRRRTSALLSLEHVDEAGGRSARLDTARVGGGHRAAAGAPLADGAAGASGGGVARRRFPVFRRRRHSRPRVRQAK